MKLFGLTLPACITNCLAVGAATLLAACGGGGSTDTPTIVQGPGYTLAASIAVNTAALITGQEVRLSPSVALTGTTSVTVTQVSWNFGDGSPAVSISNAASFTTPQFKSYAQTGTYIVSLSATDSAGRSGSVTRSVAVSSFAPTGLLNDTGVNWCSENITTPSTWVNNAVCSALNWAGNLWGTMQDAYHGRDAQAAAGTLVKAGSGYAGFDFTSLGADGQPLAIQNATYSATGNEADGTRWDCIKDNHTGLIWEVKRMDNPTHLRHFTATFTWYQTENNGGSAGTETGGQCRGLADHTKCNTSAYLTAVNALPAGLALCGFRDWRMPSKDELIGITNLSRTEPAIDSAHFPDVNLGSGAIGIMWSASPDASNSDGAWGIYFNYGYDGGVNKSNGLSVRLVRSGQ